MIEIFFTESAAASMMLVKSVEIHAERSTAAIFPNQENIIPTLEEPEKKRSQVEENYQIKSDFASELENRPENILCFPLVLSMGDISEPFSDNRADFLQSLVLIEGSDFAGVGQELMQTARSSLKQLLSAVDAGMPIRVWYSRNPDEFCGFCHMLTLLPEYAEVRVVELPEYEVQEGVLRAYTGWSEVDPMELMRLQSLERILTDVEKRYFAGLWRELQADNGALRAVVNGRLCTVGADFYDAFILRELDNQPVQFHEARLVGSLLGKYLRGLSGSLVALRIEEFISRGMLIPATVPAENSPIYHRYLKKGYPRRQCPI